ncbi:hypothetical protein BGK67_35400 (plasmid) [Streptomyces subrutilus]|uniref:Uncharacterized protein n=1 Tax=Streptomyces subrutilus TaxID=36818 RepID=A0A1E5NXE7_9ACTN|nr:hypothetical protein BGK67_35400 [Streptomyces subrutilus]
MVDEEQREASGGPLGPKGRGRGGLCGGAVAEVQAVVVGVSPRSVGHPSGYQEPGGGRQDGPLRGRASAILAAPTSLLVGRSCPTDRGEPPPTGWGVAEAARPAAARRGYRP